MNWNLWWSFVTLFLVLDLVPGPAVLLVLSNAIRYGSRRSVSTILGHMVRQRGVLRDFRHWHGALLSRGSALALDADNLPERSSGRLFVDGFLMQIANPKRCWELVQCCRSS